MKKETPYGEIMVDGDITVINIRKDYEPVMYRSDNDLALDSNHFYMFDGRITNDASLENNVIRLEYLNGKLYDTFTQIVENRVFYWEDHEVIIHSEEITV